MLPTHTLATRTTLTLLLRRVSGLRLMTLRRIAPPANPGVARLPPSVPAPTTPYLHSLASFPLPLGSPKAAPPYASSHDALAMPGTVLGKEMRKGTPILARLG